MKKILFILALALLTSCLSEEKPLEDYKGSMVVGKSNALVRQLQLKYKEGEKYKYHYVYVCQYDYERYNLGDTIK